MLPWTASPSTGSVRTAKLLPSNAAGTSCIPTSISRSPRRRRMSTAPTTTRWWRPLSAARSTRSFAGTSTASHDSPGSSKSGSTGRKHQSSRGTRRDRAKEHAPVSCATATRRAGPLVLRRCAPYRLHLHRRDHSIRSRRRARYVPRCREGQLHARHCARLIWGRSTGLAGYPDHAAPYVHRGHRAQRSTPR